MRKLILVVTALGFTVTGCKSKQSGSPSEPTMTQPSSAIVQQVEAAGSGDLESLNEPAIQNWLAKHSDVAKRVSPQCGQVARNASAAWGASTEERVCDAVAKVMFFEPKDLYNGYGTPATKKTR